MPNPIGNLYTAGAVQFNTQPLVNLSMQLAARRQAKEDAFNQYLQTAASKLSPAGVRNADLPEFNDKTAAWQKFVMTHKNELSRSPELQMQANALYQQAATVPVISKKIEEEKKPLIDKLVDPNFRKQVDEEELFPMIHAHDEPASVKDASGNWVPNPKFKQIDYTSPIFSAPNYDQEKASAAILKGITPVDMPGEIVPGTQSNGMVQRKYTNQFNNGQLAQIGRNAIEYTAANKDSQRYYKQRYNNLTEEEHKKYNDIYQSVYGKGNQFVQHDGEIIDHAAVDSPDKLHAAMMIEKALGGKKEFTKLEQDYGKRLEDKRTNIYINQSGSKKNDLVAPDLTEYETVPGKGKDITPLMGGIKVTAIGPKGETFRAEKAYYDPKTKKITLKEYGKKDETVMSLQSFLQNIASSNTGADLKRLEGLGNVEVPKTGVKKPTKSDPLGLGLQ